MKEINLACFSESQSCQIISQNQNLIITNPLENKYLLNINNLGTFDCQIDLESKNFSPQPLLTQANLVISQADKLIFHGSLVDFFQQKTNFGLIKAKTNQQYLFNFDFSSIFFEKERLLFNFDLVLNFNCLESIAQNSELVSEKNQLSEQNNQPMVLSAGTSINSSASGNNQTDSQEFHFSLFYYLLASCLFVCIFFVIIKFVNGKKKKSTKKLVV